MEVEWLPFELRLAPGVLPRRRCPGRAASTSAITGATDGATASTSSPKLAQNHARGRDPRSPYQARSTLAPALHSFAEERGRGRAHREAAHHAFFVAGQDLGD